MAPAMACPGRESIRGALRHIGLYAYRVHALLRLSQWPPAQLELREKLEQLRALAHGMQIRVAIAAERPGRGCEYRGRSGTDPVAADRRGKHES